VPAPLAVLIDVGETLLAEEPVARAAGVDALLARFPGALDPVSLRATYEEGVRRVRTTNEPVWSVLGWLRGFVPEAHLEEAEDVVRRAAVRMTPMPRAREALEALRAARIPAGVVTNTLFSARAMRGELERQGLGDLLDFVVSSADVGSRKPDPAVFRAALRIARVPAARAWFVGDSWEKDVCGAAAVGIWPIWFGATAPPPAPTPSCAVARDWEAFRSML
jgi:putative hydrolase of the HAD superfamily